MSKILEVIAYKYYFEEFLNEQTTKVQDKIFKIIEAIENLERVPGNYLIVVSFSSKLQDLMNLLVSS